MSVAGVKPEEVTAAIAQGMTGNTAPTEQLLERAARNLGMSSGAALRDNLLPSLGVSVE